MGDVCGPFFLLGVNGVDPSWTRTSPSPPRTPFLLRLLLNVGGVASVLPRMMSTLIPGHSGPGRYIYIGFVTFS